MNTALIKTPWQLQMEETPSVSKKFNEKVILPIVNLSILIRCEVFFKSPLESLGLGQRPAVCVPCDMPAMNAFGTMMACNVSNVGVVDQRNGGVLVASLSAADFRYYR